MGVCGSRPMVAYSADQLTEDPVQQSPKTPEQQDLPDTKPVVQRIPKTKVKPEVKPEVIPERYEPDGQSESEVDVVLSEQQNWTTYVDKLSRHVPLDEKSLLATEQLRLGVDNLLEQLRCELQRRYKIFRSSELVKCHAWMDDHTAELPDKFNYVLMLHSLADERVMHLYPTNDHDPAELTFSHLTRKMDVVQDLPLQKLFDPKTKKRHYRQAPLKEIFLQTLSKLLYHRHDFVLLDFSPRFVGTFKRKRSSSRRLIQHNTEEGTRFGLDAVKPFYILNIPMIHRDKDREEQRIYITISLAIPWFDEGPLSLINKGDNASHVSNTTVHSILTTLQTPAYTEFTTDGRLRFSTQLEEDEILRKLHPWSGARKCLRVVMLLRDEYISCVYNSQLNRIDSLIPDYWIKTVAVLKVRSTAEASGEDWVGEKMSERVYEIFTELRDSIAASRLETIIGSDSLREYNPFEDENKPIEDNCTELSQELCQFEQQLSELDDLLEGIDAARKGLGLGKLQRLSDIRRQAHEDLQAHYVLNPRLHSYAAGHSIKLVSRRKPLVAPKNKVTFARPSTSKALRDVTMALKQRPKTAPALSARRKKRNEYRKLEATTPDVISMLF